ncbi:hypothetical protein DFJ58DRAFT_725352 [Suillus subalutaceus]|uniref:uncharacterized protein n=1 Tax=Suillus subalutaceus TaxID=48586 RepID=UPI001B877F86|nr:uncharacterized protein DFJ58DRAFT_725352 [Suillus subalutaceus]KAG1862515.1 hypothetical protein DFJ58DRAFT_725352 [Suillus subalutaceus]
MAKLQIATDRSAAGVLVSDVKGRDIKIDSYTLSFHGRLRLIEGAETTDSAMSTFLQSIAERDIGGSTTHSHLPPPLKLEKRIKNPSIADDVDDAAVEAAYEELEEMDPNTFKTRDSSILHGLGFSQAQI